MRRRIMLVLFALVMSLTACGKTEQSCRCSQNRCACCQCGGTTEIQIEDANQILGLMPEILAQESSPSDVGLENITESTVEIPQEQPDLSKPITQPQITVPEISQLTEGEKQARRELMSQLDLQREALYALPNSIEKTNQIAQIDALIIENNAYDFSNVVVNFIGDSITEGVGGDTAEDGTTISYVNYVKEYLNIGEVLNRGKAGRMFSNYGNAEYSFAQDVNNIVYPLSNVTVVFLGCNDFLSEGTDKRFGEQNLDSYSTAGYCGAIRQILTTFENYLGEQEIFFVITYNVDREINATYSDLNYIPTQADFMSILKSYTEAKGYHVIDLYNTGFFDLADSVTKTAYTADGLHPNNSGYMVLAQHIAAEIALAMSNK